MKAGKTISIAFGFIGAVVGAGMASGAEVAAYFTPLGSWAIPAILVSAAFMAGFFYLLMRFSAQQGFSGIGELCRCLYPSAGGVLQYAIYLGGVTVGAAMLSASGELISAFAGWPNFCGALLMLALSCAVVACGARGVERVSAILMPTVVLFFVLLLLFFPAKGSIEQGSFQIVRGTANALVYASYNLGLSVALVLSLAKEASQKQMKHSAVLAWGSISAVIAAVHLILAGGWDHIHSQLPMLDILMQKGNAVVLIYAAALLFAIFTTNTAAMYNFALGKSGSKGMLLAAAVSFGLSFFRLTDIVRFIYPISGISAVLIAVGIVKFQIHRKRARSL